jgi:hypothetical protein
MEVETVKHNKENEKSALFHFRSKSRDKALQYWVRKLLQPCPKQTGSTGAEAIDPFGVYTNKSAGT